MTDTPVPPFVTAPRVLRIKYRERIWLRVLGIVGLVSRYSFRGINNRLLALGWYDHKKNVTYITWRTHD